MSYPIMDGSADLREEVRRVRVRGWGWNEQKKGKEQRAKSEEKREKKKKKKMNKRRRGRAETKPNQTKKTRYTAQLIYSSDTERSGAEKCFA